MTTYSIEIREYPSEKKLEIADLSPLGASSLIDEAKQLVSDLEDRWRNAP